MNLVCQLHTANPGYPAYAAPEASNPFLGALVQEMLTGRLPAPDDRPGRLRKVQHEQLLRLVRRCLSEIQKTVLVPVALFLNSMNKNFGTYIVHSLSYMQVIFTIFVANTHKEDKIVLKITIYHWPVMPNTATQFTHSTATDSDDSDFSC